MKVLLTGGKADGAAEAEAFIPIVAVYIVFSVFSLIGYWGYYYCNYCKCCSKNEGYKGLQLYIPAGGMFVMFLYIAIVSIIGLANSGGIYTGFEAVGCTLIDTMYKLGYGTKGWIGIAGFA